VVDITKQKESQYKTGDLGKIKNCQHVYAGWWRGTFADKAQQCVENKKITIQKKSTAWKEKATSSIKQGKREGQTADNINSPAIQEGGVLEEEQSERTGATIWLQRKKKKSP